MKINYFKKILLINIIIILLSTTIVNSYSINISKQKNYISNLQENSDGNITKWAVLIACSGGVTYERHERRDRNDVRVLKKTLIQNGWDEENMLILMEEEATKDAILKDSFQWLKDNGEDEDDIIFFFYSGHGYYHTTDQMPIDELDGCDEVIYPWDPDMAGWNWDVVIVDDELSESFNSLNSDNIVIIIHTCHAGGFIDGTNDLCDSGRVVMVSCAVDEASCMMHFPIHWLFPYYLNIGLIGWADKNRDSYITAEELLEYTKKPVHFRSQIYNWLHSRIADIQHPQIFDGWPSNQNNTEELILIEK